VSFWPLNLKKWSWGCILISNLVFVRPFVFCCCQVYLWPFSLVAEVALLVALVAFYLLCVVSVCIANSDSIYRFWQFQTTVSVLDFAPFLNFQTKFLSLFLVSPEWLGRLWPTWFKDIPTNASAFGLWMQIGTIFR
jgi:hypothetical protein